MHNLHPPPGRDTRLSVLVDAELADFIRTEAAREYTSISGLLARLAADLRRQRQRSTHRHQEVA